MPTTPTQTWEPSNRLTPLMDPGAARCIDVGLAASTTYAAGTVLGEVTATPGRYRAYASGNVDGSQVARVILQYACVTDASNNITWVGEWGQTTKAIPAYYAGVFSTADLTGLDAGAVTNLGGALVEGTVSAGIVRFG